MKTIIKQGQLSDSDEKFLHRWFRSKHPLEYTFSAHAKYRLRKRRITKEQFWEAMTGNVEIIKFSIADDGEPRLTMRSAKKFKNKRVVAVFNPTKHQVVTVYYIKDIPNPIGRPIKFNVEGYIKKYERRLNNEQTTKNTPRDNVTRRKT